MMEKSKGIQQPVTFQEEKLGNMPANLYMDMRFLSHNTIVCMHRGEKKLVNYCLPQTICVRMKTVLTKNTVLK